MPMNAAWHRKHPAPPKPTMAQRVAWHSAHAKACGCRPMPATVRRALEGSSHSTEASAVAGRVRDYLAALPPDARKALRQLRALARTAAPKAVEAFSYGIPGLRVNGRPFVWYAAWARHTSLYPMGDAIRRRFAADLDGLETSKGTIRFPVAEPLPVGLVRRLLQARLAEVRREAASTAGAR
jgi:uncharacterized protein YdhG (YjbR/CyaY superfamily)